MCSPQRVSLVLRHFDLKTSTDFDDYGLKTSVVLSATVWTYSFLTRELRACARASCRYDVENGSHSLARSLARLVDSYKFFFRF